MDLPAELARARERLVFALDLPDLDSARVAAERLRGLVGTVKVGLELFTREGPAAVALGTALGCDVFLDLKLHDIPATVGRAVANVSRLGARYLTVHASGGDAMLRAATEQAQRSGLQIVAVTLLTSLDEHDLGALGNPCSPGEYVLRAARTAHDAGVRAFVCSPREARALRDALGPEVRIITPGIRPRQAAHEDQKRVATPAAAIAAGADQLVVGRPLRDAPEPAAVALALLQEIADAGSSAPDAAPGSACTGANGGEIA